MKHLSEAQLDGVLNGAESAESALHLGHCARCRAEVCEFRVAMGMYNQASSRWSEAKSIGLSRDLSGVRTRFRVTSGVMWSGASALGLVISLGGTVVQRHIVQSGPVATLVAQGPASAVDRSAALAGDEIAKDNAMLNEIDLAVREPIRSPLVEYGPNTVGDGRRGQERD